MELSAPGLENPMLRLDPLSEDHLDLILGSGIEEAIWKWMPALPGGTNLQNYYDFMLQAQKTGLATTFILFRQSDGAFAGVTGFNQINKIHRRLRNALAWHPPELATSDLYQAGQHAMIKRAYDWRAKRIEWQVNTNNAYIMGELCALAPQREALFRNYERTADGVWVDKAVFSMTRPEMTETLTRLEASLFD